MNIDIHVINTGILTVATVVAMIVAFILRRRVGFFWLTVVIEVLLLTVLVRRVNVIGAWLGLDLISQDVNDFIISWVVIVALYVAFVKLWQRRDEISQIAALHEAQLEKNRRLLKDHEVSMRVIDGGWVDDLSVIEQTEALNKQIEQALKT